MDDAPAQSSNNSYGDKGSTNQQGMPSQPQQQAPQQPDPVVSQPSVQQPVSAVPHKEHAPIAEQIQVSDPLEAQPEIHQELKEHGVEALRDEAKLELTREQQHVGMQHAPGTQPVVPVVKEEEQSEFPINYERATVEAKKGSVWSSLRWLATFVLRQMKIKRLTEEHT